MKEVKSRLTAAIISLLLLLTFTSCSYVYDADITGTLVDASGNGIANVKVYAYLSESEMNSALASYKENSVFDDSSAPQGVTSSSGSFAVPTLRWNTGSPVFGKDGDKNTVYFIFFSKDYGIHGTSGYTVQSDSTNPVTVQVNWSKVTTDDTIVVNFTDYLTNTVVSDASSISFSYSYSDGYETITQTVSTGSGTGSVSLGISYLTGSAPQVRIYDITIPSGYALHDTNKSEYTIDVKGGDTDIDIYLSNLTRVVNLSFRDASSSSYPLVSGSISFNYTYYLEGESEVLGTGSVAAGTSGSAAISVEFPSGSTDRSIVIDIYNLESVDDLWSAVDTDVKTSASTRFVPSGDAQGGTITVSYSATRSTVSADLYLRKNYITIPSAGLTGYAVAGSLYESSGSIGTNSDNGQLLTATYSNGEKTDEKLSGTATTRTDSNSTDDRVNNGYFTGVGNGERIYLYYTDSTSTSGTATLKLTRASDSGYWTYNVTNQTTDANLSGLYLSGITSI